MTKLNFPDGTEIYLAEYDAAARLTDIKIKPDSESRKPMQLRKLQFTPHQP